MKPAWLFAGPPSIGPRQAQSGRGPIVPVIHRGRVAGEGTKRNMAPRLRLRRSGRPDASQVRLPSKIPSKIAPTTNLREDKMASTNDAAMTRRGVLASAGAGAGAAALGSTPASAQTGAPKTVVL